MNFPYEPVQSIRLIAKTARCWVIGVNGFVLVVGLVICFSGCFVLKVIIGHVLQPIIAADCHAQLVGYEPAPLISCDLSVLPLSQVPTLLLLFFQPPLLSHLLQQTDPQLYDYFRYFRYALHPFLTRQLAYLNCC